jgi:hypothetical protein
VRIDKEELCYCIFQVLILAMLVAFVWHVGWALSRPMEQHYSSPPVPK